VFDYDNSRVGFAADSTSLPWRPDSFDKSLWTNVTAL